MSITNTDNLEKLRSIKPIHYRVKEDKALEVVVYIAYQVKNLTPSLLSAILFLAEHESFNDWGRGIIHDSYTRYNKIPTPRFVSDLIQNLAAFSTLSPKTIREAFTVIEARDGSGYVIVPNRKANTYIMSRSDTETLDKYCALSMKELEDLLCVNETIVLSPVGTPIGWEYFLDTNHPNYAAALDEIKLNSYFIAL